MIIVSRKDDFFERSAKMSGSKALVISLNEEMRDNLALTVKSCGFGSISVSDGSNARNIVTDCEFDLIILNTPLADEYGLELAAFITENTASALIVTAAQKNYDEIYRKIGDKGCYILSKPFTKSVLVQAVNFTVYARKKLLENEKERRELEKKLYNLKQINRAKCVLIQYLRITEEDAHRQIQKRAMDQRVPEVEVALDILKTYEM